MNKNIGFNNALHMRGSAVEYIQYRNIFAKCFFFHGKISLRIHIVQNRQKRK